MQLQPTAKRLKPKAQGWSGATTLGKLPAQGCEERAVMRNTCQIIIHPTAKRFQPKAQGCEERATLGNAYPENMNPTPTGLNLPIINPTYIVHPIPNHVFVEGLAPHPEM